MFSNLFVKKDYIENYFIADIIVVEGRNQQVNQVLERNRLILKDKHNEEQYIDLYNGYYHRELNTVRLLYGFGYGSNVCFQIIGSLVYYYPFLANKKISVEEAKILFDKIPKIKLLMEKGININDNVNTYNLEPIKVHNCDDDNEHLLR